MISPLLANVYLHEVLDKWFEAEVKPRLGGRALLIRYADDFVIAFSTEADARRVLDVLPKRFGKYGLTLHPAKTRLVPFHRPRRDDDPKTGGPGNFDLLGFRHYWAKSIRGRWVVKRKTSASRFGRALKRVKEWCKVHLHHPLPEQQRRLSSMLRGHYAYFGITGNSEAIARFRWEVQRVWRRALRRRSHASELTWPQFHLIVERYPLPRSVVVHSSYRRPARP